MAIIPPISGQDMNSTYSDYEGRVPGNGKFFYHQPSRGFSPPKPQAKGEEKANATEKIAHIPNAIDVSPANMFRGESDVSHIVSNLLIVMTLCHDFVL